MAVALRVLVSGRVQGVFFRAWTRQQATELGVRGWVQNCSDGSVEAHLEGEEGAIRVLIDRLGIGPPAASVSNVDTREAKIENCTGFEVRH
jgi:acylphosphatase